MVKKFNRFEFKNSVYFYGINMWTITTHLYLTLFDLFKMEPFSLGYSK